MESNIIELYNLSGYNNVGGSIRGTGVYLATTGNIDLRGTLHGESDLRINAYDILHTDMITGKGYIEPRFYVSTSKSIIKALINMRSFEIQLSPIG